MATAVVTKKFPAKTGAPQVKWLLKNHGPMTVWEIVDELKERDIDATWSAVDRVLKRLREKGEAGVFNYKEEDKRHKTRGREKYVRRNGRFQYAYDTVGEKYGGTDTVKIWGLVNEEV